MYDEEGGRSCKSDTITLEGIQVCAGAQYKQGWKFVLLLIILGSGCMCECSYL